MQIRFDGKTVVVSGAGHGFGRCIAATFAGLGARVFGCDLSAVELAETARTGVKTAVLDLTDRAAAAAWITEIGQTTGGAIDVLVNNAGGVAGQEMRAIEEVLDADWDRIFAINIGAAFALSPSATRSPPRKRRGCGWAACRRSAIRRGTASSSLSTARRRSCARSSAAMPNSARSDC